MIEIPTRIGISPIHGFGLFCAFGIMKGSRVWSYDEQIDRRIDADDPEAQSEFAKSYGYKPNLCHYIEIPGDAAMFINHSKTPNLEVRDNGDMHAARDIRDGEELTSNYYDFDTDPESGGPLEPEPIPVPPEGYLSFGQLQPGKLYDMFSPELKLIVGTHEQVERRCDFSSVEVIDGALCYDHNGEDKVFWESSTELIEDGADMVLDEEGSPWKHTHCFYKLQEAE